jgi:polysaccharide export outer membrane protein
VSIRRGHRVRRFARRNSLRLRRVNEPGSYPLDKDTNILEGITIAGGFTEKASPSRTRVIRVGMAGPQVLEIDMNDIVKRGQRDKALRLQANDVVVVPESFF